MKNLYMVLCMGLALGLPVLSKAQLTARFGSDIKSGCSPIVANFSDSSTGSPTSWKWDLGNGTTSTLQNPSTTYITPGKYTVTLTVSRGTSSSTVTDTAYITVLTSPTVNFRANDTTAVCPPLAETFTNLSVPGASGTTSYIWDFGDGTSSTLTNPSHTYTNAGNYTVALVVTNSNGCKTTLTKSAYIKASKLPVLGFSSANNNACVAPATVSFTNTTTSATSYIWNFGDGTSDTVANPRHTYSKAGSYTVTLIAMNTTGCADTLTKTNFVNIGNLNAAFTAATTTCAGAATLFTDTSTPSSATVKWYFGDGGTSTTANPSHVYTTSATYTVKLVASMGSCSDTVSKTITVNAKPTALFTASNTTSCTVPFTANFTNSSSGATSYQWYFGDGTSSTSSGPSHSYTGYGNDSVTLIAINSNGCKDTLIKPDYIKIAVPNYKIFDSVGNACAPATVHFYTTATSLSSYTWNFGDGTTSSSSLTPSHTYSTAGTYNVTLTYTTSSGCSGTATLSVTLYTKPVLSFSASATTVCPRTPIKYTNTSTGATHFLWIFDYPITDTETNPNSIKYTPNPGIWDVVLIGYNGGCSDTLVKKNYITVRSPYVDFTPVLDCSNRLQVSFINKSHGDSTDHWDFGDGTTSTAKNPTHTYTTYGIYFATLTCTDTKTGCSSEFYVFLNLLSPKISFSANDSFICKGKSVTFNTGDSEKSYKWMFGTSSVTTTSKSTTYTFANSGIYTVTLIATDTNGCYDTVTKSSYIHVGGPAVNFTGTPLTGCAPLNVLLKDSTYDIIGIQKRVWSFGDGAGNTGNATSLSHTYYGKGAFSVSLVVTDSAGCKDSLTKANYINLAKPVAGFKVADTLVCPGQDITFTNTSTGTGLTYKWSFGDGTTSTLINPVHAYTSGGYYDVQLITTNSTGCSDTFKVTALIHVKALNISFTMSDSIANCPPLLVNFTNTSSGLTSFSWSLGNGSTSILNNPSAVYSLAGVYTVTLRGQGVGSCIDSVSKKITVNGPRGTLSYLPTLGCAPVTVTFTSADTNTSYITWDMNNGYTYTTKTSGGTSTSTYSYTYTTSGKYLPVAVISDGATCNVAIKGTDTITIDHIKADFTFLPDSVCSPSLIRFTDTADSALTMVTTRHWDFGDGTISTSHNPTHTYTTSGNFNVKFVATNGNGCSDTIIKTIVIYKPPVVSAGPNISMCYGQGAPAKLAGSGAVKYTWFPATGLSCIACDSTSATPATTTTYSVVGIDANGCIDTASVTITVHTPPAVTTDSNIAVCKGNSAKLIAYGASKYLWYPATGLSCATCDTATATPLATTTYSVIGTDAYGCTDTVNATVVVHNLPVVTADSNQTICKGKTVQINAHGAETYSWSPSVGLSCSTCSNPFATPGTTTIYKVTGIDSNGCVDTGNVSIKVNPLPVVSISAPAAICLGSTAELIAHGADSYTWYPASGLSCTACDSVSVNAVTTSTYYVIGTDTNKCVDTMSATIKVNPLPTVVADSSQSVCKNIPVQLIASGAVRYSWSPAATLSCAGCYDPIAAPAGTTTYFVTGTDANGCIGKDSVVITIKPSPVLTVGPPQAICIGNSVQLGASGAGFYTWLPSTGLSSPNSDTTAASPKNTTTYTVIGKGLNGCTDSGQVTVTVYGAPDIAVNPGTTLTLCNDSTVQLSASGASTYVWSPGTYLNCTSCPDPVSKPTANITYSVIGTDIHGCTDSNKINISVIQHTPTSVGPNDTLCKGGKGQLYATGGTSYTWLPDVGLDNNTSSNPVATPDTTTTYMAIIKQGQCFIDTNYVTVVINPNPSLDVSKGQTIIEGGNAQLFATGANINTYEWSPSVSLSCASCSDPVASPKQTTTYTVNVSTNSGCTAQGEVTVIVRCDNSQVFIPNTFTPNGDGVNDRFYVSGKGVSTIKRFSIYNRWGELLYDIQNMPLNNPVYGWDGTYKGQPLKPDVFVYIIDATCETGEPLQFKGDISLVR